MNWIFSLLKAACMLLPMMVSAEEYRTLIISGQVPNGMHIDRVKITYCDTYYGYSYFWSEAPTEVIDVIDGYFGFNLQVIGSYQYVKFEFFGNDKKLPVIRQLSAPLFFMSTGSEIVLNIVNSNTCVFDGERKELIETQYHLRRMRSTFNTEYRHIYEKMEKAMAERPDQADRIFIDFLQETRKIDLELLEEINGWVDRADGLSGVERVVVKANECYRLKNVFLENLGLQSSRGIFSDKREVRKVISEYHQSVFSVITEDELSWPWKLSWAFMDYAYFNALMGLVLPFQVEDQMGRVEFSEIYEHITTAYSDVFRDRLLTASLLNFGLTREIPDRYYRMALEVLSDSESVELISRLVSKRTQGAPGFSFRLPDTTGQYVSFSDFKGKVMVLDFWFTGCPGCLSLAKAMRPVQEHFKNNSDVMFINISVDKNREIWKESIRSGKHDSAGSISLFTEGRGDNDEIIKHYKIIAFPTLIIFDKNGNVAYFNPRGPYSDSDKADFIGRIEGLL